VFGIWDSNQFGIYLPSGYFNDTIYFWYAIQIAPWQREVGALCGIAV
jgi:hypothetical protein